MSFFQKIPILLLNKISLESLGIFSVKNPQDLKIKFIKFQYQVALFFYPFYFNPDNLLGSLNKTFFKPKMYKQTQTKLKIKST